MQQFDIIVVGGGHAGVEAAMAAADAAAKAEADAKAAEEAAAAAQAESDAKAADEAAAAEGARDRLRGERDGDRCRARPRVVGGEARGVCRGHDKAGVSHVEWPEDTI